MKIETSDDMASSSSNSESNSNSSSDSSVASSSSSSSNSSSNAVSSTTTRVRQRVVQQQGKSQHLYEQIGAPTILYIHKPSFNSYTNSSVTDPNYSIPIIPTTTCSSRQMQFQQCNQVLNAQWNKSDVEDVLYPPQPWGRKAPPGSEGEGMLMKKARTMQGGREEEMVITKSTLNQMALDANQCIEIIRRSDRARIRMFSKHILKHQNWNREWYVELLRQHNEMKNKNEKNNETTASKSKKNNGTKTPQKKKSNGTKTTKRKLPIKDESEAIEDVIYNHLPFNKNHYEEQQKMHDSLPYILMPDHRNNHCTKEMRLASAYRKQRRHCSLMEGYCAPFFRQAVRYGFGDERESLLDIHKSNNEKGDDDDDDDNEQRTNTSNNDNGGLNINTSNDQSNEIENFMSTNIGNKSNGSSKASIDEDGSISNDDSSSTSSSDSVKSEEDPITIAKKRISKPQRRKRIKLKHGHVDDLKFSENPRFQGNCISLLPCVCSTCRKVLGKKYHHDVGYQKDEDVGEVGKDAVCPSFFLLHPTGDSVSVSSMIMPSMAQTVYHDRFRCGTAKDMYGTQVDVGGKVLQIDPCFNTSQVVKDNLKSLPSLNYLRQWKWYFNVRTPTHCSIIECTAKDKRWYEKQPGRKRNLSNKDGSICQQCSGTYRIREVLRVHLYEPSGDDKIFYEPLQMATNQDVPSSLGSCPTFAVISRPVSNGKSCNSKEVTNIIHHVTIDDYSTSRQQKHCIANIKNISRIEYSNTHPMVLWAAARSTPNSSLYVGRGSYRRPMMGYGDSLFSIDLRCDQANFFWSPSRDEFMMDGIHSISSILSDYDRPHRLYAKSISTGGKLYEIDTRMPSRTVFTWGLAGLCDNSSSRLSPEGIYGCGAIMTRPLDLVHSSVSTQTPILCVNQNQGAFGIQLYQRPWKLPRFQTRNLELPLSTGLGSTQNGPTSINDGTCYGTSSSFALSDASESINVCGLAAFYTNCKSVVADVDNLGYREEPQKALCIVSLNSFGTLTSHTLIAASSTEEKMAEVVEGAAVGSCAIKVPFHHKVAQSVKDKHFVQYGELLWSLSDTYPVKTQATAKHHVATRSQCRDFDTVQLRMIPCVNKSAMPDNSRDSSLSLNHPMPATYLGDPDKPPTILKINSEHAKKSEMSIQDSFMFKQPKQVTVESSNTDLTGSNVKELRRLWNASCSPGKDDDISYTSL